MVMNGTSEAYNIQGFSDNGIVQPYFVNGYNLSADDLLLDDRAIADRAKQLARVAGYGVAQGLVATNEPKTPHLVRVEAGLGVTQDGQVIFLKQDAQLNLRSVKLIVNTDNTLAIQSGAMSGVMAVTDKTEAMQLQTTFGPCNGTTGPKPGTSSKDFGPNLKDGVYVLVAQGDNCQDNTTSQRYNRSPRNHDGVSFKLLALGVEAKPTPGEATTLGTLYRNRLAYLFFGDAGQTTARERAIPFGAPKPKVVPPESAPFHKVWQDAELPLAVIYWDGSKAVLIENWSVRRRMVHPNPAHYWESLIGDVGAAEGQARLVQFQAHLVDRSSQLSGVNAASVFRWMPPAGYLPAAVSQPFRERLGQYIVRLLGDDLLGLKEAGAKPIQAALQAVAFPLVEYQARSLSAGDKPTLLDVEEFFEGHLLIHKLGTLNTAHHVLHRSWYDAPLNTQARDPIIIYTLIDPLLASFWRGLDSLMTGTITDSKLIDSIRAHLDVLRKYWERLTGSPNASLQELTRAQLEVTNLTASSTLPFVVYVRAEPEDYIQTTQATAPPGTPPEEDGGHGRHAQKRQTGARKTRSASARQKIAK